LPFNRKPENGLEEMLSAGWLDHARLPLPQESTNALSHDFVQCFLQEQSNKAESGTA
jgi:hypothetical protein